MDNFLILQYNGLLWWDFECSLKIKRRGQFYA